MAKEREKIELKTVDEEAEKIRRYLRLHADSVEEVEELPPIRVGEGHSAERGDGEGLQDKIKARTNEPDIGSLIEKDEILPEEEWETSGTKGRKLPWGWVVLIGCVFAGGVLWSLVAVKRSDKRLESMAEKTGEVIEKSMEEEKDAEDLVAGIETAVSGFFGSGSVEEMLGFVRQRQRVAPLMENHYGKKPLETVRLENVRSLAPVTVDNRATFWIATCELEDGRNLQVLVEAGSPDGAKVDWETYINYQPMDWDDFARSRPGGYTGDFRVYVEPDFLYSHEFSDSRIHSAFRLTTLKGLDVLYGYAPRGGELARNLTEIIERNGGRAAPVILRLHLPEGLESKNGVVIEELVCPRWVFVDSPEKEEP